ncbi:MAG TPA: polyprenyl diphosphate synthase [Kofleriaceae bacterium]|nr:polyprenyl diphosphate synthase [Kofleriaceae bacterium]
MSARPRHVGIIMDGNGRWATRLRLPRAEGHRAGAEAVRRTVRAARELEIPALTLYAFSEQNWGRPSEEVTGLMGLLATFLRGEVDELAARGVRLVTVGDRARLPEPVRERLAEAKRQTAAGRRLLLCLALSYGSREAIVAAARTLARAAAAGADPAAIDEAAFAAALDSHLLPPLDLVVRTSGEQRLSNFLLWEAAYAELHFTEVLWPDFARADLEAALAAFARRRRRFGLADPVAPEHAADHVQPF